MATEPDHETLAALARLARDLPHVDPDGAWRRLGGLTPEQQAEIEKTVRLVDDRQRQGEADEVLRWMLLGTRPPPPPSPGPPPEEQEERGR